MPTSATTATAAALSSSLALNRPNIASLPLITSAPIRTAIITAARNRNLARFSCQVAIPTDVSSSSSALTEEELEAESKVGKRIRVKVPLKVYHVAKAPDLDLNGREGVIKQYVCIWKGKRISANLPFKVEFFVPVEGQPAPVKLFAHLKEDEFELLDE